MQILNAHDVKDRMQRPGDTTVIDVLPKDQHDSGHIPGSKNVPFGAEGFVEVVKEAAGGKEKPVVVYCASSECDLSPKAAQQLENAGFTGVSDFEGGMEEWTAAGFEVEAG